MSEAEPQGSERRVYTRYDVALPVELEVAAPGSSSRRVRGTTINVSRGGVLVDVGITVEAGASCRVCFTGADGEIEPAEVAGSVVHAGLWKQARQAVAVQFTSPLETLAVPDTG